MSHPLTYDTLPAHSQLRREFAQGVLKIIAAAEEPGPLVRRAALIRSALPAALICFVTLVIGLAVFGAMYVSHRASMPQWMSLVLAIIFSVFCVALFTFTWRIQYSSRLHAAATALRQTTVLAAAPGRLLIETSGPLGSASYDLKGRLNFRMHRGDSDRPIDSLQIVHSDGTVIHVLWGRDEAELDWVARAIASAMQS
jgi:hypothetical protein